MSPRLAALSVIGWIIFASGLAAGVASLVGLLIALQIPKGGESVKVEQTLHETYYVIHRSPSQALFYLCLLALAFVIGYLGFTQTGTYRKHVTPNQITGTNPGQR